MVVEIEENEGEIFYDSHSSDESELTSTSWLGNTKVPTLRAQCEIEAAEGEHGDDIGTSNGDHDVGFCRRLGCPEEFY